MARGPSGEGDGRDARRAKARARYDALESARKHRRESTKSALRGLPLSFPNTDVTSAKRHDRSPVRRPSRKLVLFFALVTVIVLAVPFLLRVPAAPPLTTSCTQPGIATSTTSTSAGGVVRYAVTGPSVGAYAVAVDAQRLDPAPPGKRYPVAVGGRLVAVAAKLTSCKGDSRFKVTLAPGEHRVQLFRDGVLAATRPLTVR